MAIGIKWRALPCDFPPWRTLYGFLTRRSEEHTSELQSHPVISYAVFCLKKKKKKINKTV